MDLINILEMASVSCGSIEVPGKIAYIVSMIIKLIQYGVPLLLIIFGMLDLGKAVIASKEDEIKKGQQMFIKRLIAAVIVFFVVAVVELVVTLASGDDMKDPSGDNSIVTCIRDIIKYDKKN